MSSFFLKSSYYRAYGQILGGIIAIFCGINYISENVDDYPKINGIVQHTQIRWQDTPFDIEIRNKFFSVYNKKKIELLKKKIVVGEEVTIWYDNNNNVLQLKSKGEIILYYNNPTWFWSVLIILGFLLSLGSFYYIMKYPQHRKGEY